MLFKELHGLFPGIGSGGRIVFGQTSCCELHPWSGERSLHAWPIGRTSNWVASVRVDEVSIGERVVNACQTLPCPLRKRLTRPHPPAGGRCLACQNRPKPSLR